MRFLLDIRRTLHVVSLQLICHHSTASMDHDPAFRIFQSGVSSVLPQAMITSALHVRSSSLQVGSRTYSLSGNVYLVGCGKAVLGMARAVEDALKEHLVRGIVSVPKGIQDVMKAAKRSEMLLDACSKIQVREGSPDNIPDADAVSAASEITELISSLQATDLLIVLISGGGSSLLPSPVSPLTLQDKQTVVKMLASSGATIQEINSVRKRLSLLKGGGLAQMARPAQVLSLILSDIVGDPLDLIASGPTVKNCDDRSLPRTILERYNLMDQVPKNVIRLLQRMETDSDSVVGFEHVQNVLLGNNEMAVKAAAVTAKQLGYTPVIATCSLEGHARKVGTSLARLSFLLTSGRQNEIEGILFELDFISEAKDFLRAATADQSLCILCAGETVVQVRGAGRGGRNQELALSAALEMHALLPGKEGIVLLSAGTDGIDGPTPAAGAVATPRLVAAAEQQGLDAARFLHDNDSFSFYSRVDGGEWQVITGHTGTNVMDLIVLLLQVKKWLKRKRSLGIAIKKSFLSLADENDAKQSTLEIQ